MTTKNQDTKNELGEESIKLVIKQDLKKSSLNLQNAIDFNPILDNLNKTIKDFLNIQIDRQKQNLTKSIYNEVRNQLVKQLNGEVDLFTPDYKKSFYDDFMKNFNTIFEKSRSKPQFPNLMHGLDENEYIAIICDHSTPSAVIIPFLLF